MVSGVVDVTADEIIQEIENLPETEKNKLFTFLLEKFGALLSPSFDFWDNEEDSVYDTL
ncbi:hypothetical protein SAMN02745218_01138 [Desulfofundulus australicus DSM 11792]|uniref:Uncharacterized protein n=3 Tax=Peptococcaceae TaxID=186807 RepID=A0A1M4XRB4_9FIRM|nr:hypothetical protein Desku_0899 [Desulfofundulus kuznetsovii DSM 6115]SHE95985.1 hypothetical protein SAMN02745218_01138 [Desulfofundulus australicus DSM 11792]